MAVDEVTGVAVEIADVDHVGPDGAAANRQLGESVIESQRRSLGYTSFAHGTTENLCGCFLDYP